MKMKVLFATDGGKQCDAAVESIRKLALVDGDEIKVISVVDMALPMAIDIYGGFLPDTSEFEKNGKRKRGEDRGMFPVSAV